MSMLSMAVWGGGGACSSHEHCCQPPHFLNKIAIHQGGFKGHPPGNNLNFKVKTCSSFFNCNSSSFSWTSLHSLKVVFKYIIMMKHGVLPWIFSANLEELVTKSNNVWNIWKCLTLTGYLSLFIFDSYVISLSLSNFSIYMLVKSWNFWKSPLPS